MSYLWAVNSLGKVYILSTAEQRWTELETNGIDFKRVSSNDFFTWAIGGDHQIYIYVPTRDIPIRYRVVTYENERWNPIHGFSDSLLPTDRPHWSSADGLISLPKNNFSLPSKGWEWEEEWYIEDNLKGQPLEPEGWTYAVDFPAKYGPNKIWNSCVRRRKWVRYRRFCATNKWSMIPSIHEDPVLEPFIDVAIGGTEIPGGEAENFSVWAVTIMGRIAFRYGVTQNSPEGSGWVPINTPEKCEISQVSVGPTGLIWTTTWDGSALVRAGVTRENIMGSDWIVVEPPSAEEGLIQVSVGKMAVWAISKSNKVWFRKGVDGLHSGENVKDATGSGWIEMFGNLGNISVALNDQVFSISMDYQNINIRTGIDTYETCGRTWKTITAPLNLLHHGSSLSSLNSMSTTSQQDYSSTADSVSLDGRTQSFRKKSDEVVPAFISNQSDQNVPISCDNIAVECDKNECGNLEGINLAISENSVDSDRRFSHSELDSSFMSLDIPSLAWQPQMEPIVTQTATEVQWTWVSASGCSVDSGCLPNWFSEGDSTNKSAVDEPWYEEVVSKLKARYNKEMERYSEWPKAIEKTFWIKTATCRWFKSSWMKCLIELLQYDNGSRKSTLSIHYLKEMVVIQVSNITCVASLPDWNKNILAVHTASRTSKGTPYKFSFSSHDDLEDWFATLNMSIRNVNQISRVPVNRSIWSTTVNGDVYVHTASSATEVEPPVNMKWTLLGGGHLRTVETCPRGITWGLGYNCTAYVYTKGYGGGPYHGIPGCNSAIGPMSDVRCLYIYENQRWNPLSGFTAKGLPTDRYMWSDVTGRVECTKENTHLPSGHWQWISDWCIDYKAPGGVDSEGWQYATDFPRSYHGYKRFTDYVRRRRWYRKCRLSTSGPWAKLGNTPLIDMSLQMDSGSNEYVAVWAVAVNGDVLFRKGVSEEYPKISNTYLDEIAADDRLHPKVCALGQIL
ncbi:tectonin beta-propeller repeat-containing protein 1-like [Uloborus diversus]|uniref:tectonin beta-propeller repeat-containing protein 1-like n=1 Tax=Uloborus diversus TaxID=327109 RepID=UPI00240A09E0|nr:tectonin beta-propeller repeat-containing protein 1-like [Uloborus diversus]